MNPIRQRLFLILLSAITVVGCRYSDIPFDVSGERALKHVASLADSIGTRVTGSDGEKLAKDYIEEQMRAVGLDVTRQRVGAVWASNTFIADEREYVVNSENIIGTLHGGDEGKIIISGHVDSWGWSVPGANDNASAIGVMLEVARAISNYEWNFTVVFAAFCGEERGLLGSKYFVDTTDLENLLVAINMDPVGNGNLFLSPIPGVPPQTYQKKFIRLARTYGIKRASVDPLQLLAARYLQLGFGADHMSFLDAGYEAFSISNSLLGWNYHSTHDKIDYIDATTLEDAARLIIAFLLEYDDNSVVADVNTSVYVAQPLIGTISVLISEIYLSFLVGISFLVFVFLGILERDTIKTINPFRFLLLFLKIVLVAFVQILFVFLPVFAGTLLEGTLYPWFANPTLYLVMGIASGLVGLFFIIQLADLLKIRADERQLKYWSILLLLTYTILSIVVAGLDIAYYFAAPLLLFLVALRITDTVWLLAVGVIGIFPILSSVGPTQITMLITLLGVTVPVFTLMIAVFVLSLPFIFHFAAAMQGDDRLGRGIRNVVSTKVTPGIALMGLALMYYWSSDMEVYHEHNPQLIQQSAFFDLNTDQGVLHLASYDYIPPMQDIISGRYVDPADIMLTVPLEVEPGLTDLLIESESYGDTLAVYFSMSIPHRRDFVSMEVSSPRPFAVVNSKHDHLRRDGNSYYRGVLSPVGFFTDTLIIRRDAPVLIRYSIHTMDASEQPVFKSVTHPLAFRYYQRMQAVITIE